MSAVPDSTPIAVFCTDELPTLLRDTYHVDTQLAEAIGQDVLVRAKALAALDRTDQDVVAAPFVEEVFAYQPLQASPRMKAAVAVVVRNSMLESIHTTSFLGPQGIAAITTKATEPLSRFVGVGHESERPAQGASLFALLRTAYPKTWACFAALDATLDQGGVTQYRLPGGPAPQLPAANEHAAAKMVGDAGQAVLFSAIDPRFDEHLIEQLTQAVTLQVPLYVPTLSRLSRNQNKLFRIVEYLLAHGVSILTTNYLLRPQDVWVRRRELIRPDNWNPLSGLDDLRGLSGVHRAVAIQVRAALG